MSETPTPIKGQTQRRGLALPPRGQALARLQDLEQEQDSEQKAEADTAAAGEQSTLPSAAEISNAVNTASSNAVIHQGSDAALTDNSVTQGAVPPAREALSGSLPSPVLPNPVPQNLPSEAAAGRSSYHAPVREAREPTTRITVDMPDSLHRKISLLSVETRRSIKDLVIEALAEMYFAKETDRQ